MSPVFVDTSALYAVLDRADVNHHHAAAIAERLLGAGDTGAEALVTHGGVVIEATALAQRRLGMSAVRSLVDAWFPLMEVVWVDAALHDRACSALLAADRRDVSLVDWTSFEVMRQRAIGRAFAFDDDFVAQGFELVGVA